MCTRAFCGNNNAVLYNDNIAKSGDIDSVIGNSRG